MFRAVRRSSSGALTVFAVSGLHTHVVTGRSQVWVGTQNWAFNERWNNKFCYKVGSCWLFLLNHTTMHGSMNIKFVSVPVFRWRFFQKANNASYTAQAMVLLNLALLWLAPTAPLSLFTELVLWQVLKLLAWPKNNLWHVNKLGSTRFYSTIVYTFGNKPQLHSW